MWQTKIKSALNKNRSLPDLDAPNVAAALLLLSPKDPHESFDIVLTKRTQKVDSHKGQISLPGGFREPIDGSWEATALRESFEEIGVPESAIQIWGAFEPVVTGARVMIVPFVGIQREPVIYKTNPDEVEKILVLPSEELLRQGLKPIVASEGKFKIESIGLHWQSELIWGATARILDQLYQVLLKP